MDASDSQQSEKGLADAIPNAVAVYNHLSTGRNAKSAERSVTYDATYPNGITVKTVVTAEWAQDMLSFEHGHPKFGYAGSFHEKRPPSAIELMLLDIISPQ